MMLWQYFKSGSNRIRLRALRSGPGVNSFKEFRRKPFMLLLKIELLQKTLLNFKEGSRSINNSG